MSDFQPEQQARQQIDQQFNAADYMLFADGKAIGIIEAKKEGITLSAVHTQAAEYSTASTKHIQRWADPLPFIDETTGIETLFTDEREPDARARKVFAFHRPEELLARVRQTDTLRDRLKTFPTLITAPLRDCQIHAVSKLETSLADNRPRSLIQMATGSGKTYNRSHRVLPPD